MPKSIHNRDVFKAYFILNTVNGKSYIGITSQSLKRRWGHHLTLSRKGGQSAISKAIHKYGAENFTFAQIASSKNYDNLLELEQILIRQYQSYGRNGYNRTLGGDGTVGSGSPVEIDGVRYPSLGIACEAYGLVFSSVYQRINKLSWTLKQAFELEPSPVIKGNAIELEGIQYPSVSAAALDFHLPIRKVNVRLLNGWTLEEALELIPRADTSKKKSVVVNEKRFSSIADLAKQFNIDSRLVRQRIYMHGWTPEESVGLLARNAQRKGNPTAGTNIFVAGILFPSIKEAAKAHKLEAAAVARRLRCNWTVEQAFGIKPAPKMLSKKAQQVTVNELTFRSWTDACKHFGLSIQSVKWRLANGWSTEEAFGLRARH